MNFQLNKEKLFFKGVVQLSMNNLMMLIFRSIQLNPYPGRTKSDLVFATSISM